MKTTLKERHEIRKGCHMYHNGMCLDSPCFCLKIHKQNIKQAIADEVKLIDNKK